MLLFLSLTGIILSIILLSFNAGKFRSSLYLGSFFLLISIYSFVHYALIYSKSVTLVSITYINLSFITYLIGPALYWYIRSVLNDDSRLRKRDLWHFLPAILFLATSISYFFTPPGEKIMYANEIVDNISFLARNKPTILHQLIPNDLIFLSRPLLVMFYVIWCAVIFIRFLTSKKVTEVFPDQKYMIKWISLLLILTFILTLSQVLLIEEAYAVKDLKFFFTLNLVQIISVSGLACLLITPFFFPGILYGLPRYPQTMFIETIGNEQILLSQIVEKKKMPGLGADYLEFIQKKLESCMNEHRPYLKAECNMAYISKCLEIPVHHIAYYFREIKRQSFNDYRNNLRIDYAKQLIREGKAKELTLEGIGLLSGFSTRNTFFTAFKKIEGINPSAYSSRYSD